MPVILLNREGVTTEILELARGRIMAILDVPSPAVTAKWEIEDGRATPSFDVDLAYVEKISEDEIRQAMRDSWHWIKDALNERLAGLGQRRG